MALITVDEVKSELNISGTDQDTYIGTLRNAIESLWDEETGRTWESSERTQYYNSPEHSQVLMLDDYPVSSTADFDIWDDPDWEWGDADKIDTDEYRIDYDEGIFYYDSYFYQGKQSIKVTYTAGYTSNTFPNGLKQILIRQICHWYHQGRHRLWDKDTETEAAGGGSVSFKALKDNYLPEFALAVDRNKKRRCL